MDTLTDDTAPSWGAKVNTDDADPLVAPCPPWATPLQQNHWTAIGLVWWDARVQQILHLPPVDALDLLRHLRIPGAWQTHGLTLGSPTFLLPESPRSRSRRQPEVPPSEAPSSASQPEMHLLNPVHLTTIQAQVLLQALETHESVLRTLAEPLLRRQADSLSRAQQYFSDAMEERVAQKLDLSTRPLPWTHDPEAHVWVCNHGSNRVTVRLADTWLGWRGCLERLQQFKRESPFCPTFDRVLTWGEEMLLAEAKTPKVDVAPPTARPRLTPATLTAAHRKRLKRYWIEPSALEPAHSTYRVFITLQHVAIRREYRELSFGEKMVWNEQYPAPADLMRQLGLYGQVVAIDQVGGFNDIASLATYADATTAREWATQLWERSTIATAFQAGDVSKARYGIQEVETLYRWDIGGYGEWYTGPSDRDAFLAHRAFYLTLAHALDIAGYRAAMPGVAPEDSDHRILIQLHEQRMESLHIPSTARAESAQWLREHRATAASTATSSKGRGR